MGLQSCISTKATILLEQRPLERRDQSGGNETAEQHKPLIATIKQGGGGVTSPWPPLYIAILWDDLLTTKACLKLDQDSEICNRMAQSKNRSQTDWNLNKCTQTTMTWSSICKKNGPEFLHSMWETDELLCVRLFKLLKVLLWPTESWDVLSFSHYNIDHKGQHQRHEWKRQVFQ